MIRKEFIENEIKLDPENPMNYYLLALEFRKLGNYLEFESALESLINRFNNYLPTYYIYAEYLFSNNQNEKAEEIIKKGIDLAFVTENTKMIKELKQLNEINS
jgi:tetratricopeptide (TPR) repeat protein